MAETSEEEKRWKKEIKKQWKKTLRREQRYCRAKKPVVIYPMK